MAPYTTKPTILTLDEVIESELKEWQQSLFDRLRQLAPRTIRTCALRFRRRELGEPIAMPGNKASLRSLQSAYRIGLELNCLHPDPVAAAGWRRVAQDGPVPMSMHVETCEDGWLAFRTPGEGSPRAGRRQRLATLPKDWLRRSIEAADTSSPMLRSAVLVLAITGCRPAEVQSLDWKSDSDSKVLTLTCAKSATLRERDFRLDLAESVELSEMVGALSGYLMSAAEPRPFARVNPKSLENLCQRISLRLWPELKPGLTVSCYRNLFSADLKRAGVARELIAYYMGHTSTRTAGYYGTHMQGKTGRRDYLILRPAQVECQAMTPPRPRDGQ
ncbi:MAG: site-specific integrase [Burkholderiales bacterium]